jgi:hypothetical protein
MLGESRAEGCCAASNEQFAVVVGKRFRTSSAKTLEPLPKY